MSLREGSILDNLATVRRMASAGGGQEAERGNREEPGLQRHRLLPDSAARSAGSDPAPLCPGHSRSAACSYNPVPQVAERPDPEKPGSGLGSYSPQVAQVKKL